MRIPIASNQEPMVLALTLRSNGKQDVRIRVADAKKPGTSYTDRVGSLNGTKTFFVRMPRTGKLTVADIFTPGQKPTDANGNIQLVSKEILDLPTFPNSYNSASDVIKCAVNFIQDFAERAGITYAGDPGTVIGSNCNRFRIDYMDVIRDRREKIPLSPQQPNVMVPNPNYGAELTTPARISQDRGIIEVSKKYFLPYAVPYRVAILLHEISHFYLNADQHSEEEADLNALKIFLGLGYGYIDAENAFLEVFKNADTPQNRARYEKLNNYIIQFEKENNKLK